MYKKLLKGWICGCQKLGKELVKNIYIHIICMIILLIVFPFFQSVPEKYIDNSNAGINDNKWRRYKILHFRFKRHKRFTIIIQNHRDQSKYLYLLRCKMYKK